MLRPVMQSLNDSMHFQNFILVAAIFLALYIPKAGLPSWTRGMMGGYVMWHLLCEILLFLLNQSPCTAKGI